MESEKTSVDSVDEGILSQLSIKEESEGTDSSNIRESALPSTTSSNEGISTQSYLSEEPSPSEQLSILEDTTESAKSDVHKLEMTSEKEMSENVLGEPNEEMAVFADSSDVNKDNESEKIMIRLRRIPQSMNITREVQKETCIIDPNYESSQFFAGPRYVPFYPVDLPMVPASIDESGHKLQNWFVVSLEKLTKTRPISVSIADDEETTEDYSVPDIVDLQFSEPCYVPFYAFNFTKVPIKSSGEICEWIAVPLNTLSYSVKPQAQAILITTVADPDPDEHRLFLIQQKLPIFDDNSQSESIPVEDRDNADKFAKYSDPLYIPFYPAKLPSLPLGEIDAQKLNWYVVSFDSILQLDECKDTSSAVDSVSPTIVYKDPLLVPVYKTRLPNYPAKEDKLLRQLNEWNALPMSIFKRFVSNTPGSEHLIIPEDLSPVVDIESPKDTETTRYNLKRLSSLIEGPSSPNKYLRPAVDVEERPLTNIEKSLQNYQDSRYAAFSEVSNKLSKIKNFMKEATSDHLYAAREDHGELLNIFFEFDSQSAIFDSVRRNLGMRLEKFNSFIGGIDPLFMEMYRTGNSHAKTLCTIMGVTVKLFLESLATQAEDISVLEAVLSNDSNDEIPERKSFPFKQLLDKGESFLRWNMAYNANFNQMLSNLKDLVADAAQQCSPIIHPLKEGSESKEHQTLLIISTLNKMLKAIKKAKEEIESYCIEYELSFYDQSGAILLDISAHTAKDLQQFK